MKKIISMLLLAVFVCITAAGCSIEVEEKEPDKYSYYYLNQSETSLRKEGYNPKEENGENMLRELMQYVSSKKAPEDGIPLLPENVVLNSYDFQDSTLVIDF